MYPRKWFELLPVEIAISIFRQFFTFDEKVKVLKDDYFAKYLSNKYAWKDKPDVSLKTLKGAAENFLNEIEEGFYDNINNKNIIYKVQKYSHRGELHIFEYAHKTLPTQKMCCKKHKVIKDYLPTNQVKRFLHSFRSNYKMLKDDIYTDALGLFKVTIDYGIMADFECNTLIQIHTNFFIFKKEEDYSVIIHSKKACSNTGYQPDKELLLLLVKVQLSNYAKIIKSENYIAYKLFPWHEKFKLIRRKTFNFMSQKKLIKVTYRKRFLYLNCKKN